MTLPQTQKALVIPTERAPWELRTDWPVPAPGPKEVLVKVVAAALNPIDWKIQSRGVFFVKDYPYNGGMDGAGIVEAVGEDVVTLSKGDKILFPGGTPPHNTTFREYCVCPADHTAKIPENLTFEQAASIPLCLTTVACGIWTHGSDTTSLGLTAPWEEGGSSKYAGKPALILGGSSSVGQFAIQAARMNGFSPIIATSSLKHTAFLQSLGATHVLDRALPPDGLLSEIAKVAAGAPLEYAYDAVSNATTLRVAHDALAPGGGLVSVAGPGTEFRECADEKRVVTPFASFLLPANRALGGEVYARLEGWLRDGTLVPNRVEMLPDGLMGVAEGLERMKNQTVSGVKLVVRPGETP